MLRQVVVPVLAAYLLCVALVLFGARHPVRRPGFGAPALTRDRLPGLLRYLARLEIGGYAVLLLIIAVFSVLIVGDREALWSATWSGAFLLLVATPVFVALSALAGRQNHRSI
ncbi:MAG: DUF6256 family protein [Actinomycetota bacterium]